MKTFASAIYTGTVRHRRFSPKQHEFQYQVFMMYLDTREIEQVFSLSPFWSLKHFAPVQFKRSDFHINQELANDLLEKKLPDIDESVRRTVFDKSGIKLTGPIRMLVNLRYWGINMNPLSTYYCFDEAGENLIAILAEVHNTPWNQRHSYVLTPNQFAQKQQIEFAKEFHVSPFNPMHMHYCWQSTTPANTLALHLENWQSDNKVMDATMALRREEINSSALHKILIRFPWMTVKVISAIYWQAFKLWWKGTPVFNSPAVSNPKPGESSLSIKSIQPDQKGNHA
jgi:DUF1365 family protein